MARFGELKKKYTLAKEKQDYDTICDIVFYLNNNQDIMPINSLEDLTIILKEQFGYNDYYNYNNFKGNSCYFIILANEQKEFFDNNMQDLSRGELYEKVWNASCANIKNKYVLYNYDSNDTSAAHFDENELTENEKDELEYTPYINFTELEEYDMDEIIEFLDKLF